MFAVGLPLLFRLSLMISSVFLFTEGKYCSVKLQNGKVYREGDCDNQRQATILQNLDAKLDARRSQTAKNKLVEEGWNQASNNRYYKHFNNENVDYETAKSRCESLRAKLAAAGLRSAEMRKEIRSFLPNPLPDTWIGLDDLNRDGEYVWSDGVVSTRDNTNWRGGGDPHGGSERCCVINNDDNRNVMDVLCSDKRNYLCEL